MFDDGRLREYPNIASIFDYVNKRYTLFLKTYNYISASFSDDYLLFCEEIATVLGEMHETEASFANCLDAFIKYSHEYLLLQANLIRKGKYFYSNFDEVNQKVYQSDMMNGYYLDGLFVSQILWPNHYKIGRYFIGLKNITSVSSRILDMPSGAGIYSYFIVRHFQFNQLSSIDISPYSVLYTKKLLTSAGLWDTKKISLRVQDIYDLDDTLRYDLIVCGELLEHVEDPEKLLIKIRQLLNDQGMLFLTTAIYAAAIDHIYLFKNTEEVRDLLSKHFLICSELILPVSLEEYKVEMTNTPINYACLLRKAG
jgi:2-polyprenyl-3-methyl-5-hydroxy-6-metoxy-1,4-benzoquinol methylase